MNEVILPAINGIPVAEQCLEFFSGHLPVEVVELKDPVLKFNGTKIPYAVWRQVLSFLGWTYREHNREAQVRLAYSALGSETGGTWHILVLPQEASSGLATKELEHHADKAAAFAELPERAFILGTVHHHCNIGAFQSDTDSTDETRQNGLHVTLGHMARKNYEFHARATFRGAQYDAPPVTWFAFPEDQLTAEVKELCFPEAWKTRIIIPKYPVYTPTYYTGRRSRYTFGYMDDFSDTDLYGSGIYAPGRSEAKKLTPLSPKDIKWERGICYIKCPCWYCENSASSDGCVTCDGNGYEWLSVPETADEYIKYNHGILSRNAETTYERYMLALRKTPAVPAKTEATRVTFPIDPKMAEEFAAEVYSTLEGFFGVSVSAGKEDIDSRRMIDSIMPSTHCVDVVKAALIAFDGLKQRLGGKLSLSDTAFPWADVAMGAAVLLHVTGLLMTEPSLRPSKDFRRQLILSLLKARQELDGTATESPQVTAIQVAEKPKS